MALGVSAISGYSQSDEDTSGTTQYFGFIQGNGSWYILQVINNTSFRYFSGGGGNSNYSVQWTNRDGLAYDYYDNIFMNV